MDKEFQDSLTQRQADMKARLRPPATWAPNRSPENRPGWVYIVAVRDDGPAKIGLTFDSNPLPRITRVGHALPYNIEIVMVRWDKRAGRLERLIHSDFADVRIKGEWFDLKESDYELIYKRYRFMDQAAFEEEIERRLGK